MIPPPSKPKPPPFAPIPMPVQAGNLVISTENGEKRTIYDAHTIRIQGRMLTFYQGAMFAGTHIDSIAAFAFTVEGWKTFEHNP